VKVTVGQIFNIGTIILGAIFGIAAIVFPDKAQVVGAVGAIIVPAWGAVGVALTTQGKNAQEAAGSINTPSVQAPLMAAMTSNIDTNTGIKSAMVEAVSNLKGVDPLQLNRQADSTLINMGASKDPSLAKVLPPKS